MTHTVFHIIATLTCAYSLLGCTSSNTQKAIINDSISCLAQAVPELARHPTLIHSVHQYNTGQQVYFTDQKWLTLPVEAPQIQALIQNDAANLMKSHITQASWQGEGILIGLDGGLVAITEKTSDYWQQDEKQFTQALHLPKGEIYVQKQVVDKSTDLMLIKVSTPVYSSQTHNTSKPIGVLVIGFDQFVVDFNQPCKNTQP